MNESLTYLCVLPIQKLSWIYDCRGWLNMQCDKLWQAELQTESASEHTIQSHTVSFFCFLLRFYTITDSWPLAGSYSNCTRVVQAHLVIFMSRLTSGFFLTIFWLLLVDKDGLKIWPRQFVTTWYHSCFDTSNISREEEFQTYIHKQIQYFFPDLYNERKKL